MNDTTFKTGQSFPQGKFANYQTTLSTSSEGLPSIVSRRISHNFCCDEMAGAVELRLIVLNEEDTFLAGEESISDGRGHFNILENAAAISFCPFCGGKLQVIK